jgi:hypothetical protein
MKQPLRWMRSAAAALVAAFTLSAIAVPQAALAGTTGTITGTVTDAQTGAPLANVHVTAASPSQTESATTNGAGFYSLQTLTPDTYTVSFQAPGYNPSSEPGITAQQDFVYRLDVKLTKEIKTIAKVTSRAAGNLVKPYTGTDVYNVSGAQLNAATGGDNLHRTIYEYLNTVPGVTPIGGSYPAEPSIRGGYDVDNGYELEGIPITERMTGYFTTNLTDLGISNVEVFTGGLSAANSGNGMGVINSVIKTGRYPAFGSFAAGLTTGDFNHYLRAEYGGATPNQKFSYYFGFDAANSQNQFNNGEVSFPIYTIGISSGNPGYIATRDFEANFHYRPSQKDDIQFFYQNSLFDDKVTYNLFSGTSAAPLLALEPCAGAAADPNTTSGAAGGTAPNGQTCPDGLYFKSIPNGSGNYLGHYSGIGKIQWNHIIDPHSSLALRLAENFNQYIFDQPITDNNDPHYNDPNGGTLVDSGCPQYPYAAGTPLQESNGSECTFDYGDYYQNRYANDYYLSLEYNNTPTANTQFQLGVGQEYDNQKRDVRYLNHFNNPNNDNVNWRCLGLTFSYSCLNAYTDIPTHVPYVYAQGSVNVGKFTFSPGLRYSMISYGVPKEFGGAVTSSFLAPSLSGTYRMGLGDVLRFSYGTSAQFIGTEFVYRLGSSTYNPQKNGPGAYQPQLNHTIDLMLEHQFNNNTSLRFGPYYRVTNNYLGTFYPITGYKPSGAPILGPGELQNGLHIRALGAELGLTHENRDPVGVSYWLSASYNNYWTQMSEYIGTYGAGGGQVAFVSSPLSPYFTSKGIYVRGYQTPLIAATLTTDLHANGYHLLPVLYYAYGNFFNTGGCAPGGVVTGLGQTPVSCTSGSATKNGAPVQMPTQIAPGYFYANVSFLKELGSHYVAGVRVSNLTNNLHGAEPCYGWHDPFTDANLPANVSTGCLGQNGPQSNYYGPTGYIYQNVSQSPRNVEFFLNYNF